MFLFLKIVLPVEIIISKLMRCLEIGGSLSLRANDPSQCFLPDFDMVDSGDLLDLKMRQNNRIANSMNK